MLYYGVMFRTRDLLILVIAIMLTMVIGFGAIMLMPEEPQSIPTETPQQVIMSTPRDSYTVVPYEEGNTLRSEREAFIEKVRQKYVPQSPTARPEPEQKVQTTLTEKKEPISEPLPPIEIPNISIETSTIATGTTYGNTDI